MSSKEERSCSAVEVIAKAMRDIIAGDRSFISSQAPVRNGLPPKKNRTVESAKRMYGDPGKVQSTLMNDCIMGESRSIGMVSANDMKNLRLKSWTIIAW